MLKLRQEVGGGGGAASTLTSKSNQKLNRTELSWGSQPDKAEGSSEGGSVSLHPHPHLTACPTTGRFIKSIQ